MSESQENYQPVSEPQLDQGRDKERLEQEQSEKAVLIYERAISEWSHKTLSEIEEARIHDKARVNAKILSRDGARLGMPGYPNCKLQFIRHYDEQEKEETFFRISPNGADGTEESKKEFLEWEDFVQQRFEENGLPFRSYY